MEAGAAFDITPYGTETMHVLRAEKGFIIVGQDTDGSVTPVDLGMDWIVAKNKDFLGRRSLTRPDTARPDRKQLVGLLTDDPATCCPKARRSSPTPARRPGADARPRHVELLQRLPRALDRAGTGAGAGATGSAKRWAIPMPTGAPCPPDRQPVIHRSRRSATAWLRPCAAKARWRDSTWRGARPRPRRCRPHRARACVPRPSQPARQRGDPHFAGAVSGVLGDGLPIVANTLTEVNGVTMYWLGPDEWLIVTPDESREAHRARLAPGARGQHAAFTDVSGGQTALHLHGRHVRDVLAKGCPIDLHPRVFGIGQCAQSHLGKAPVLIGQIEGSRTSSSSCAAASRITSGRGSKLRRRSTAWRSRMTAARTGIALFDLDYTLLGGDATYEWIHFLVRRGAIDRAS